VIPTHNRPQYLRRTLRYLSSCATSYPVIVADSGDKESRITNTSTVSSFSSMDILYRTFDASPEPFGGFESKIIDALNHSNSKYCVLLADDDFIAGDGICQCVDFLERNPGFAVAHGDYLYFWVDTSRKCVGWKPVYEGKSLTHPDPAFRLKYHLSHYPSDTTFYAVHQTAFLKHVLLQVIESGLQSVVFRELYSTGITVIHGKTKCLNIFYSAKDRYSGRVQSVPDIRRLRAGRAYRQEENRFKDALASYLFEHSTLSAEASRAAVEAALSGYLEKVSSAEQMPVEQRCLENTVIFARESLKSRGLGWIYDYFRRLYRKAFPKDIYSTRRYQFWIRVKGRLVWINYEEFKNTGKFALSNSLNMPSD